MSGYLDSLDVPGHVWTMLFHQQHRSSTKRSLPAGISHRASGGSARCVCTHLVCRAACAAGRMEHNRQQDRVFEPDHRLVSGLRARFEVKGARSEPHEKTRPQTVAGSQRTGRE
eukprot:812414-Prymnesium_polylepis.1